MPRDIQIYTIGHSDHTTAELIALFQGYEIACVVDVRSQPYSRWAHQFNRETLASQLQEAGISYRFMGDVLGGRPSDPSLYDVDQERPDYRRMEQTTAYQRGIEELVDLAAGRRIAVMCSEGDHSHCHRHLLITQTLLARGVSVYHIQPDGAMIKGEPIPRQLSLFD
jgi:uncharacterized protein (DUF488 family)